MSTSDFESKRSPSAPAWPAASETGSAELLGDLVLKLGGAGTYAHIGCGDGSLVRALTKRHVETAGYDRETPNEPEGKFGKFEEAEPADTVIATLDFDSLNAGGLKEVINALATLAGRNLILPVSGKKIKAVAAAAMAAGFHWHPGLPFDPYIYGGKNSDKSDAVEMLAFRRGQIPNNEVLAGPRWQAGELTNAVHRLVPYVRPGATVRIVAKSPESVKLILAELSEACGFIPKEANEGADVEFVVGGKPGNPGPLAQGGRVIYLDPEEPAKVPAGFLEEARFERPSAQVLMAVIPKQLERVPSEPPALADLADLVSMQEQRAEYLAQQLAAAEKSLAEAKQNLAYSQNISTAARTLAKGIRRRVSPGGRDTGAWWRANEIEFRDNEAIEALRRHGALPPKYDEHVQELPQGRRLMVAEELKDFLKHSENSPIITLDMFDTLVERDVEPPEYVKGRTARHMAHFLDRSGTFIRAKTLSEIRDSEEKNLRGEALKSGRDHESTLSEIVRAVALKAAPASLRREFAEEWLEYEVAAELIHLRAKPGALDLLKALKAAGKRVYVVSDTYLERKHLERILEACGMLGMIDGVFASSDYTLGKYSSRLHSQVLHELGVEGEMVAHLGDNLFSDAISPARLGVKTVWLYEQEERKRRVQRANECANPFFFYGISPSASSEDPLQEIRRIGREVVGPAFMLYVDHLLEQARTRNTTHLYFLAREGKTFLDIAVRMLDAPKYGKEGYRPKLEYLYLSRVSTVLPTIQRFGEREIHLAAFRTWPLTLEKILRTFNITLEDVQDALPEGCDPKREMKDPLSDRGLSNVFHYGPLQERIAELRKQATALLHDYLDQHGFFGHDGSRMFSDIGWNGTIQVNLRRAFERDPMFPELFGCYFGRHYAPVYRSQTGPDVLPGFMVDDGKFDPIENGVNHCLPLFEIAAADQHGSTTGYKRMGDRVEPILKDSSLSPASAKARAELRAGVYDFFESAVDRYSRMEPDLSWLKSAASLQIHRLLTSPTRSEAIAIAQLTHDVDWGTGASLELIAEGISLKGILRPNYLNELMNEKSTWPSGARAMLGSFGSRLHRLALKASRLRR